MAQFDPAAATAAYLAQLPPEAHEKAQHYTQGGHWLVLWGFVVSVLAGTDEAAGFRAVKEAAVAVSAALEGADLVTDTGRVAGLWFLRARAKRVENGAERRVDLTFRALMDLA